MLDIDHRHFPDASAMVVEVSMIGIESTDLTMIKLKLQDRDEGPGWEPQLCEAVEQEYKRFLALKRAYPDKEIVPDRLVDVFWHQHILDTERYLSDTQRIFGYFLHHYPYFGMKGAQDYANLCAAFSETRELYALHFGPPSSEPSYARCRTQCKPVKCR